jgi:hypothetical protein
VLILATVDVLNGMHPNCSFAIGGAITGGGGRSHVIAFQNFFDRDFVNGRMITFSSSNILTNIVLFIRCPLTSPDFHGPIVFGL